MSRVIQLVFVLGIAISGCSWIQQTSDGLYLVPKGYQGSVIILFDEPTGIVPAKENGLNVYPIPPDGILKVKGRGSIGTVNLKYYYVDEFGNRVDLPYLYPNNWGVSPSGEPRKSFDNLSVDESNNSIFVMNAGGIAIAQSPSGKFEYTGFLVGKPVDFDRLYNDLTLRLDKLQRR